MKRVSHFVVSQVIPIEIKLRNVRVNNLQDIDLDIPHGQMVSICGVSGSGKSSLAFETLYVEGQRRYFECLSTYTRQFLQQLDKPDADRIDGIPPAIALKANRYNVDSGSKNRSTVATASEILPFLALMFSRIAETVCPDCQISVESADPESVYRFTKDLPENTRFQILYSQNDQDSEAVHAQLMSSGLRRVIVAEKTQDLEELSPADLTDSFFVVVDRLKVDSGEAAAKRIRESMEVAIRLGKGSLTIAWQEEQASSEFQQIEIDSRRWNVRRFSAQRSCGNCGQVFPEPEASMFNFLTPKGACAACEGFGNTLHLDMDLIVPDKSLSISEGAIAPWNTPAYEHEKEELLALAADYNVDVNLPFAELPDPTVQLLWNGVADREFGGLNGFFNWLERRKYKVQIAVFLNRWKSTRVCETCQGSRFNPFVMAFKIGGLDIAQVLACESFDALQHLKQLQLSEFQQTIAKSILERTTKRLDYLNRIGLGYLSLNRTVHSLSSGESQRVMLARILGSTLTGMLYVLDEPSSGLHVSEKSMLLQATSELSQRGNTVVMVDHDERMIQSADRVVEIGPLAGSDGGSIVFDGDVKTLLQSNSLTGEFMTQRAGLRNPELPRRKPKGSLKLSGATGNNLSDLNVEFPLRCLCAISGVSGAGKSTLVEETLYPALCQKKGQATKPGLPFVDIVGDSQIDEVVLVDQSPIGRSSRSNPVTYIKAFDEIRKTFAETVDAKARNLKPGHFSFNVDGGRCEKCRGEGYQTIDMQFMSDIHVKCDACHGSRFRDEVLKVKYRAKSIDDVLRMTVREAFAFFRGKTKVQAKLKALIDVGLEYVALGQSATTLSSGEAQRLKLAHYLNAPKSRKVLFLMDEPTFGLHMRDILKLVDCFDTLVAAGHSLIVIEHNLHLLKHSDWIIDLGPGASNNGGQIVGFGTPEQICQNKQSLTGKYLNELLAAEATAVDELES